MSAEFLNFAKSLGFELDGVQDDQGETMTTSASFGKVFSKVFNVSSETIFQTLNDPALHIKKQVYLMREFSSQKSWIEQMIFDEGSGFIPILSSCASVCLSFNYDIFLVCGLLNLSNLHKSYRLVKICAEKNNGDFVVVGLDDNNVFKFLNFQGDKEELVNVFMNIVDSAIISLDITDYDGDASARSARKEYIIDDLNSLHSCSEKDIENVTIREYLNNHFKSTNKGFKVHDDSFSNNKRIDINTSDFRYKNECLLHFQRTFDIDGFFGLFNGCDFLNCLISGGMIVKFKDFTKNKKESASLKKIFEDCNKKKLSKFRCIKFAELESSSTFEVYAVCAAENSCKGFDSFDLKSCLESAHFNANRFPCILNNCIHSREHTSTRNGRPDYHTQIKSNSFKWDYESRSFKCILSSMIESLKHSALSVDGLEMFFYVKSIGSKFKTIFTSITDMNKVLKTFLSPFDLRNLVSIHESKIFIDVAWNISPDDYFKNHKVI